MQQRQPSAWIAHIADLANLHAAWRAVRRNHGDAGADGVTIKTFQADLDTHLHRIRQALLTQTYEPCRLRRVALTKRDRRRRLIGIPTVADRVVQHALLNVLGPHFESTFSPCSYGFRPGRSAHQAVLAVIRHLGEGRRWVVEADLEDFFDTLDWTILRQALEAAVPDPPVLALIQHFLQAGTFRWHRLTRPAQGTPQGMGCSPLLANVYLTRFDRLVTSRGYLLVRYGDDFLTLHHTPAEATAALHLMQEVLEGHLKLRLHRGKTRITDARRQPFEFLSFQFHHGSCCPSPPAIARFQARVQAIIRAHRPRGISTVATQLNPLIRGWGEYFKIGQVTDLYQQLDTWIAAQLGSRPEATGDLASLVAIHARYRARQEQTSAITDARRLYHGNTILDRTGRHRDQNQRPAARA